MTVRVVSSQAGKIALALGTVYIVWGSTYLGIRIAIETIPPLLMAGCRFGLAGVLMIAFSRWRLCAPWPSVRQWRDAAIVGGCLLLAGNGGVTLAERHIPSGLTPPKDGRSRTRAESTTSVRSSAVPPSITVTLMR